jgi:hypothetical protein
MVRRKATLALAMSILALAAASVDGALAGTAVEYGLIWGW